MSVLQFEQDFERESLILFQKITDSYHINDVWMRDDFSTWEDNALLDEPAMTSPRSFFSENGDDLDIFSELRSPDFATALHFESNLLQEAQSELLNDEEFVNNLLNDLANVGVAELSSPIAEEPRVESASGNVVTATSHESVTSPVPYFQPISDSLSSVSISSTLNYQADDTFTGPVCIAVSLDSQPLKFIIKKQFPASSKFPATNRHKEDNFDAFFECSDNEESESNKTITEDDKTDDIHVSRVRDDTLPRYCSSTKVPPRSPASESSTSEEFGSGHPPISFRGSKRRRLTSCSEGSSKQSSIHEDYMDDDTFNCPPISKTRVVQNKNRKNAEQAKLNREKKKAYIKGLEDRIDILSSENKSMKAESVSLHDSRVALENEA